MAEVQLHQLGKSYGHYQAVQELCLTIPAGQITALLGPSGCGKTTILKLIAGLLQPDQGDITFDGRSVLAVPPEKRGAVMVFQHHLLFPYLNVYDNVAFGLKMARLPANLIAKRVAEMLELVKLPGFGPRRPGQLSGGQQQRVALARALIVQPKVLLLDEPLSNLDAHLRTEMRDLIFNIQRQSGITILFVTHDQQEAVILGDRLALILDGRLQQVGEPPIFYERPKSVAVARFFGGLNFIPGRYCHGLVETTIGLFRPEPAPPPTNQPLFLTIRPEHIRFGHDPAGNNLTGRLLSQRYTGPNTRFCIATSDPLLPPLEMDAADCPAGQPDDPICLHFPPTRLHCMS